MNDILISLLCFMAAIGGIIILRYSDEVADRIIVGLWFVVYSYEQRFRRGMHSKRSTDRTWAETYRHVLIHIRE